MGEATASTTHERAKTIQPIIMNLVFISFPANLFAPKVRGSTFRVRDKDKIEDPNSL